jgi:hypothetical protein
MICCHNWHTTWSTRIDSRMAGYVCAKKLLVTELIVSLITAVLWLCLFQFQEMLHPSVLVISVGALLCSSFLCVLVFPCMIVDAFDASSTSKRLLPFYEDTINDMVCLKCHKVDFAIQKHQDKEAKLISKENNKRFKKQFDISMAEEAYRKQKNIMREMMDLK